MTSSDSYDALVVGLGAMGSAALYHLAARGCRVIGVDAFDPPHDLGSTHGRSRIIREAYYEDPAYVPLVRRAYANWDALERATGTSLFRRTGGLMMGTPDSGLVRGALESAATHGIDIESLDTREIVERFPSLRPDGDMVGVLEPNAGMLFPETCVRAHLARATQLGAELRTNARVDGLSNTNGAITARVQDERILARRLVLAAGPWTSELLTMLGVSIPLVVERQTMHWFDAAIPPEQLPVTLIEHGDGRLFYVMPDLGDGMKAAIHYEGAFVSPDAVERSVGEADTAAVTALVERFVPAALGKLRESVVCLYTNTPDLHFIIDTLEGAPNVVLVSACSGHGFKFASAVGEVASQLAFGEPTAVDVSPFRANRF